MQAIGWCSLNSIGQTVFWPIKINIHVIAFTARAIWQIRNDDWHYTKNPYRSRWLDIFS
jgi:hypothetical protein